jgi:hypothetical protein
MTALYCSSLVSVMSVAFMAGQLESTSTEAPFRNRTESCSGLRHQAKPSLSRLPKMSMTFEYRDASVSQRLLLPEPLDP